MIEKYLRIATPEDVPILVKFARHFHEASPYKLLAFDAGKTKEAFHKVTSGMLYDGVAIVALHDDKPIGFIAGMASEPLFSRARISMELGWWIEPDYRGTKASVLIYSAYEDWAKRVKCDAIQGAYLPGVSPELDGFYKKRGYLQVESSYLKVLKWQSSLPSLLSSQQ